MNRNKARALTLSVAAAALMSWLATRGPTGESSTGSAPASVRTQASVPRTGISSGLAPHEPVTATGSVGCGRGYEPIANDLCTPQNPVTKVPYSHLELEQFSAMRASPFVSETNLIVPRVMSAEESRRLLAQFAHYNAIAERIRRVQSNADEIESFYKFRLRLTQHKMQILMYEHAERGGRISRHDPVLDPEAITDPMLKARYEQLRVEEERDYEQLQRARREHGLEPRAFLDARAAAAHVPGPSGG